MARSDLPVPAPQSVLPQTPEAAVKRTRNTRRDSPEWRMQEHWSDKPGTRSSRSSNPSTRVEEYYRKQRDLEQTEREFEALRQRLLEEND